MCFWQGDQGPPGEPGERGIRVTYSLIKTLCKTKIQAES